MIVDTLELSPAELHRATGWEIRPEGACKDVRCVPLAEGTVANGKIDVAAFASQMRMGVVESEGIWALGPESGGRSLESAELPAITLPDRSGRPFSLSSLRGMKVLLLAWASW